jgi:plasmid replication initiation protein
MSETTIKNKARDSRDYLVIQHNDFIRHPRTDKLTAKEADIAYFLISKVKPDDKDFLDVNFTITDFCRVCGVNETNGSNYSEVKSALKSLADKSVWIKTITEKGKAVTTLFRWVDTYKIREGDGMVTARLSSSIKPYLLELKKQYTQAQLRIFIAMKSVFSKRLYEILRSYVNSKPEYVNIIKEFEIVKLQKLLNAEKYCRYADFRVKVLEPAKREINAYTDMEMNYTPIKPGRITTHISFTIKLKSAFDRYCASLQADNALDGEITND